MTSSRGRDYGLFGAAFAALAALYGAFVVWRIRVPLEINGNEPWNAYHIVDAFAPQRLYPDPGAFINNYPPLSYYLLNLLSPLFENPIVCGRVVSLVALFALAFAVYAISRRIGAKAAPAGLAGVWFCATMFRGYTSYAAMNDPHLLGLAAMALGFWLFLALRRGEGIYLAFLVMILAGFIKNSLFAFPLAALYLTIHDGDRRLLKIVAFGAATTALLLALFYALYGPLFFKQLLLARDIDLTRLYKSAQRLQWIAIALAFWGLWLWRAPPSPAKAITAALAASSTLVWLGTGVAKGVGQNAIFELAFASAVALAVSLDFLFETARGRLSLGHLALGLAVLRLLISWDQRPYQLLFSPAFRAEIAQRSADLRADVEAVRATPGAVACSVATVCFLAGKPYLGGATLAQREDYRWRDRF